MITAALRRLRKFPKMVSGAPIVFAIGAACALGGCAANPPMSRQVSADPLLERQGGVVLLVDAAVQIETLATDDYFVVDEAKAGGQATMTALRKFAEENNIPVRGEIVSVGAARLSRDNSQVLVADKAGAERRKASQPLWVTESIANDPEYVSALRVVSTYAFERAAITAAKSKDHTKSKNETVPQSVTIDEFHKAADVIKGRTQASSVLFLGVLGKSKSDTSEVVDFVTRFTIGEAVAIGTAGLGTGYYLVFVPGHLTGRNFMTLESALIDLQSGDLTWSNAVKSQEDPIHPEHMANPTTLDLLLHNVMFKAVTPQPGASLPPEPVH